MLKGYIKTNNQYDLAFLLLLTTLIGLFWVFQYPAIVDGPQHASQLKILEQLLQNHWFYQDRFWINWFTPYVLPNLLMLPIAHLFGPIIAIKVAITVYLLVFAFVGRALVLHFERPRQVQLLSLCFLYSPALYWGFIPFLLTLSIGTIWLYFVIIRRVKIQSMASLVVSFSLILGHAIAWGLIVFNIIVLHFSRNNFSQKAVLQVVPIISPILLVLLWTIFSVNTESSSNEISEFIFGTPIDKLGTMTLVALGDNIKYLSIVKVLLLVFIFTRFVFVDKNNTVLNALIIANALLFFISPYIAFSTAYIADRLLQVSIIFIPLFISNIKSTRAFNLSILIMVLFSIMAVFTNQFAVNRENKDYHKIIRTISNTSDIFYISKFDDLGYFNITSRPLPLFLHTPHWLSNTLDINVDYSFAYVHNIMIRTKQEYYPWTGQVSYNYDHLDWEKVQALNYDYIIIRNCTLTEKEILTIQDQSHYGWRVSAKCWHLLEAPNRK